MTSVLTGLSRLMDRVAAKAFCPTGEGGGIDNSCGGGGGPRITSEGDHFRLRSAPKRAAAAIDALPPGVREKLSHVEVKVVPSVGEQEPNHRRAQGLYFSDRKVAMVSAENDMGEANRWVESTTIHELGHAYDFAYISQSQRSAIAKEFQREAGKLMSDDAKGRAIAYYAKNDREPFARLFEHRYAPGKSRQITGDEFEKAFPKSLAAFDKVMQQQ